MVSLNKSFLYGIGVASITWIISLYLYIRLTSQEPRTTPGPLKLPLEDLSFSKQLYAEKPGHGGVKYSNYINSEQVIKKLKHKKSNHVVNKDEGTSQLDELGLVRTQADQVKKDDGYRKYAYNVLISERLDLHRQIPDTRNNLCKNISYPQELPTVSVVICFYNEHFHTFLRTIYSVIDRTPPKILQEILLVDDYSDLENLHVDLAKYIEAESNALGKVKLFKTDRREGLIRARLFGARRSKAEVIIFLDSHVEVNTGWIEPLLMRIKENRTNVVMPVIDIINADTFVYTSSPLVRGGFNWGLHFKWVNLPKGTLSRKDDFITPIKSPTMAGGLFAMDRAYFTELGEYDAGMNIWGGENLEISFRIWMCGGKLEMIPCSRVGHIFRKRRPYGSPNGENTMLHNSLRVAHVWMDDHKRYFLEQLREANLANYGDISSRLQLRKELKCHDFDWYLKNVYPEMTLPTDNEERLKKKWAALESDKFQPWHSRKRNYVDHYQIRLSNTSLCMQSAKDTKTKGSGLILKSCLRTKGQMWYETDKNELVLAQLLCLEAEKVSVMLYKCHEMGGNQEWKHKGENNSPVYSLSQGMCLAAEKREVGTQIQMDLCTGGKTFTAWDIVR